jgi:GR25 family glycosyltransferase involved in LPS biosynthesis
MNTYILLTVIIVIVLFYIFLKRKSSEKFENFEKNPKIYVINMDKDKDRLKSITSTLKSNNFNFERIKAINGRELSDEEVKKNTTWMCSKFCTPGQIGCFMSHLKTWKKIANSKDNGAIIMEDDVILLESFRKKIHEHIKYYNSNPDIDILLFHCIAACDYRQKYDFISNIHVLFQGKKPYKVLNKEIFIPDRPGSAACYYISKEVAKKLVKLFNNKVSWHVDAKVFSHPELLGRVAMVEPPIVKAENIHSNLSTIVDGSKSMFDKVVLNENQNVSLGWLLSEPLYQLINYKIDLLKLFTLLFLLIISLFISRKISIIISVLIIILILILILLDSNI